MFKKIAACLKAVVLKVVDAGVRLYRSVERAVTRPVLRFGAGVGALFAAGVAGATSIVDYTTIMSSVTTELTAGIGAAVAAIGTIWGARVGVRFVKSLLH